MNAQDPDKNSFESFVQHPRERPKFFWSVTIAWVIGMIILAIYAIFNLSVDFDLPGLGSVSQGHFILAFQALWLILSVKKLEVDDVGVILFYGLPMIRVRRGPKLVVFGFFQIQRFVASVVQNQFPADPELIQKTDDKVPLETVEIVDEHGNVMKVSKVRPIRITTAKPREGLGDDILNSQMVIEFTFWVRWIVTDPFLLIVNVGGDIKTALRHMRDTGESVLNDEVTQMTPSELISGFSALQKKQEDKIREEVKPWGITVRSAGLTAPDLNHEVASELRNITKEKALAVQTRTKADATEYRLAREGAGRGKAREEELAGEGRGYKKAGESIGVDAEVVLAAQVARDTVGEGDTFLGIEGITQAVGLGKKIIEDSRKQTDEG